MAARSKHEVQQGRALHKVLVMAVDFEGAMDAAKEMVQGPVSQTWRYCKVAGERGAEHVRRISTASGLWEVEVLVRETRPVNLIR